MAYPPVPGAAMGAPMINPAVPLVTPVPRPLQIGQMIYINGTINPNAGRFDINLAMAAGVMADVPIALHINPRWDEPQPVIVRNSFLQHGWGSEERDGPKPLPIQPGQPFECIILVHSDCFKVAFNGYHYCEFKHRVNRDEISHLLIRGDLTLSSVRYQGTNAPPPMPAGAVPGFGGMPAGPPMPTMPMPAPGPPQYNLPVPYLVEIKGGLHFDKMIYISGMTASSFSKFAVNLMYYNNSSKDIAFHFNPRWKEKKVVRNAMPANHWGKEERGQTSFPFQPAQHFDIIIMVEKEQYKVAVNGQHFCTFQHRLRGLNKIRFLEIVGDCKLSSVRV